MMACEEYMDLMMKSIDGEATSEETKALHTHLAGCEACRALYESYLAVDNAVKSTEEDPPEQLTLAIMNSIRREKTQSHPKSWLHRYRFTAIAAAAAIVILAAARIGENLSIQSNMTEATADMAAAEAAPAEIPAEFRSGDYGRTGEGGTESMEAEEAPAAEVEEEAPALAVPFLKEIEREYEGSIQDAKGDKVEDGAYWEAVEALESAGYSGTVILVSGMGPETLAEQFSHAEELNVTPEITVYEIFEDEAEKLWNQGNAVMGCNIGSDQQTQQYFVFLTP